MKARLLDIAAMMAVGYLLALPIVGDPLTFVAGPSPTGWQLSKGSAMALLSSVK